MEDKQYTRVELSLYPGKGWLVRLVDGTAEEAEQSRLSQITRANCPTIKLGGYSTDNRLCWSRTVLSDDIEATVDLLRHEAIEWLRFTANAIDSGVTI